jgi:hypothetical protein
MLPAKLLLASIGSSTFLCTAKWSHHKAFSGVRRLSNERPQPRRRERQSPGVTSSGRSASSTAETIAAGASDGAALGCTLDTERVQRLRRCNLRDLVWGTTSTAGGC